MTRNQLFNHLKKALPEEAICLELNDWWYGNNTIEKSRETRYRIWLGSVSLSTNGSSWQEVYDKLKLKGERYAKI